MNHPDDLLAPYVDGSLTTAERNAVSRHLASCARCRDQVDLAGRAHDALRSLPTETAPDGLGARAIEAAERNAAERAPEVAPLRAPASKPGWVRWGTAAMGAAAVILLAAVVLPNVGTGSSDAALPASAERGAAVSLPPASRVEVQDTDYDVDTVQALASSLKRSAEPGATGVPQAAAGGGEVPTAEGPAADYGSLSSAADCLSTAFEGSAHGELVRVIEARFQGTPAYIGIYLAGPGAGRPADTATVLITSKKGCSILHSTTARI
jgi:anti-sigma factor RsiW